MTAYTMSDIKNHVQRLESKSVMEYRGKLKKEFKLYLEENPGILLDISEYENSCRRARDIHYKYRSRYGRREYSNNIESIIQDEYFESRKDEIEKIRSQFNAIINKLKTIRNPNKAIEFLKLCGIDLPENVTITQDIQVDPDFIRSILPSSNQLTDKEANG